MKITIIAVGKLKEKYWRDAVEEYTKRLSAYARLEIIEVPDEKTPENASAQTEKQILEKEGERLLSRMPEDALVAALAIEGKPFSSEELAAEIERIQIYGPPHLVFVIGGSLGLSERVLARAERKVSFSRMTFPHQLMRVILLEQVYRSFRIINHEPYHK